MPPSRRHRLRARMAAALLALSLAPSLAMAAPATVLFEGVLRSAGGGPAADGDYALTFALYEQQGDASPLWSEQAAKVAVSGGQFAHALGSVTPMTDAALAKAGFVGVRVASEPELPRMPVHAVAFARFAGVAAGLDCSGCVPVGALLFDGDVDLGGNSLKAKNALFSGDVTAKSVTAQSFAGDGSKLTGLKQPTGSCKSGHAVVGIAADGTLQCAAMAGGGELATLTGGLLTNRLKTTGAPDALPIAIPDNTGAEAVAQANITDDGKIETIVVTAKLQNSDLSQVRLLLLPPDDKQVGITLCDPCGGSGEKSFAATFPPTKEKAGSLAGYVGKSGKGLWTLKALDTAFCIPQAPGNAGICDVAKGTDGAITAFSVEIEVLSAATVSVPGTLLAGAIQLPSLPTPAPACTAKTKGSTYLEASKGRLVVCDGGDWRTLPFEKACGNQIVSGDEECDDGNSDDTDACLTTCKAAKCGDGKVWAGKEACDDGNTADGDGCAADCSKVNGKPCSNGSTGDCNPAGQTLVANSAYWDPQPPSGWVQCMGFVNTSADDVGPNALDNCRSATQIRLRIWDPSDKVVVDVWETGLKGQASWWSGGQYFDGCNCGAALTTSICGDLWPCNNQAGFYGSNNGSCGGGSGGWSSGMCLSNGNGGQVSVAPGQNGNFELAKSPSSGAYVGYKIAVYKQP
jgi:cysteine-rich repeat protein